jgi:iron-sulfur cluster assembly protein
MPITLTERAAEHVNNYLRAESEAKGLRLAVRTTGCSGYMYVVETAECIGDSDTVFESNGVQLVIDSESLKYLDGTKIDFTREGLNEGFRFDNPNVTETCGCGESFSL